MIEPRIAVEANSGHVYAWTEFKFKDVCKSVPGAMWDKERKAWHWRAHPLTVLEIESRFPQSMKRSPRFQQLVEAARGAKDTDKATKAATDLPDIPVTKRQPWLHQKQAFWFAMGQTGVMLDMHMGTGKTKVVIDVAQNRGVSKVLVLTKLKVIEDGIWERDFAKDCAVPYKVLQLGKDTMPNRTRKARLFLEANTPGMKVVVINHASMVSNVFKNWALAQDWDMVVVDESHVIKSAGSIGSRFAGTLAARAKVRIAMTGTPMPNGILDAYGQMRFIDPSVFGTSFASFRARYAIMGGYEGREVLGYQNEAEFRERYNSVAYKATKDVLDLPPFNHIERYLELDSREMGVYRDLRDDFISYLNGKDSEPLTVDNTLAKLTRLAQVTSGYLPDPENPGKLVWLGSSKSDALADLLEDIDKDEPLVIFARFKPEVLVIRELCEKMGRTTSEISGSENTMQQWKDGETNTVVVNIAAGGAGIDLTRAHTAIYWATGFNLGDYDQSTERVHRPGQTEATTFYHLLATNTVDTKIWAALQNKRNTVRAIMDEGL